VLLLKSYKGYKHINKIELTPIYISDGGGIVRIQRIISEYLNDVIVRSIDNPSIDKTEKNQHISKISDGIKAGIESQDGKLMSSSLKNRKYIVDVKNAPRDLTLEKTNTKGIDNYQNYKEEIVDRIIDFKSDLDGKNLESIIESIRKSVKINADVKFLRVESVKIYKDLKMEFKLSDGENLILLDYKNLDEKNIEAANYKIPLTVNNLEEFDIRNEKFIDVHIKFINKTHLSNESIKNFLAAKFVSFTEAANPHEGRYFTPDDIESEIEVLVKILKPEDSNILFNGSKIPKANTALEQLLSSKLPEVKYNKGTVKTAYINADQIAFDIYIKDIKNGSLAVGLSYGAFAYISEESIKKINYAYDQISGIAGISYHSAILKIIEEVVRSKAALLTLWGIIILFLYLFLIT